MFSTDAGTIEIEPDDQCDTCEFYLRGIACPLLEALGTGVALLTDSVMVKNCGFYVKHERNLRAIKHVK